MAIPKEQSESNNGTGRLHEAVADGLLYTHGRLNSNARKTREASAYLYALIELLDEKGLITPEELEPLREAMEQKLVAQFKQEGNGVAFQDPEQDKYTFEDTAEIDCASRVHLCGAACCRLPFALSRQDVLEGIVHWNLGQPYLIDQAADGYCSHIERNSCTCTIYEQRPVPCRGFDCRDDERVWLDFEEMSPNPALQQPDWPYCLEDTQETPA